jgi:hypothetical protein
VSKKADERSGGPEKQGPEIANPTYHSAAAPPAGLRNAGGGVGFRFQQMPAGARVQVREGCHAHHVGVGAGQRAHSKVIGRVDSNAGDAEEQGHACSVPPARRRAHRGGALAVACVDVDSRGVEEHRDARRLVLVHRDVERRVGRVVELEVHVDGREPKHQVQAVFVARLALAAHREEERGRAVAAPEQVVGACCGWAGVGSGGRMG